MKLLGFNKETNTRATAMIKCDDGTVGVVTLKKVSDVSFFAQPYRDNLGPDIQAANEVRSYLRDKAANTIEQLEGALEDA